MKHLRTAFLIFCFSATMLHAGNSVDNKKKSSNNKNSSDNKSVKSDTTAYEPDAEDLMDIEDSLAVFPGYDVYCQWDTSSIHFKGFDPSLLTDTTTIVLQNDDENSCYVHPFIGGVTSDFGPRRRRYHYGIDIKLETGDSVACAFDGMVRIAKKNKTYGNVVIVRHNNGLETYYAHLSKMYVEPGQLIKAGDILGLGGNTGRSYGSHLHFEIRFKGKPINPNDLICFKENRLLADTFNINKGCFKYKGKNYSQGKSGYRYYTIRKGDTLSAVARRYKTTTKQICKMNGIRTTTVLKVGRKLKV